MNDVLAANRVSMWMVFCLLSVPAFGVWGQVAALPGSATRTLSIPERIKAMPGQQVQVPAVIDEAAGVLGYRVVIEYATPQLRYVKGSVSTEGTIAEHFIGAAVNDGKPGLLALSNAGPAPLEPGGGVLVTIGFALAPDVVPGSTVPLLLNRRFSRLNDGRMPCSFQDGYILVTGTSE